MSIKDIVRQGNEFSNFKKNISEPMDKSFFDIRFFDNKSEVGYIFCMSFREYYNVKNVYINPDYRSKGYSKYFYKSALDYAKSLGRIGLISGKNLIQEDITNKIYEYFEHYTLYLSKNINGRRIVLINWIDKK